MAWAIEQQEVTEPNARFVLIALANYTAQDGSNAFPSVLRLSRDTGLSERCVQRQLRVLVSAGLIRLGSRDLVAAKIKRADRRPVSYDLVIGRDDTDAPRSQTGCQVRPNGVTQRTERGDCVTPDPSRDPSLTEEAQKARESIRRKIAAMPNVLRKP